MQIDGIEIRIEGPQSPRLESTAADAPTSSGASDLGRVPPTIVMIHGWPDTERLWDAQAAALSDRYRCVRFTLPGFDRTQLPRARSLDELVGFIERVCDAVSPDRPVVLLVHDWGCVFGYEFLMRNPSRVSRLIGVDIGDANSPDFMNSLSILQKLVIASYQLFLALAWLIGGSIGDAMTRRMARALRCPSPAEHIGVGMTYPYFIQWTGRHGGYRNARQFDPPVPMLFLFGKRKPFMFHSAAWAEALARRPGCRVLGLRTGHWVMTDAPQAFTEAVVGWLQSSDGVSSVGASAR